MERRKKPWEKPAPLPNSGKDTQGSAGQQEGQAKGWMDAFERESEANAATVSSGEGSSGGATRHEGEQGGQDQEPPMHRPSDD
jgi:hypothetical protein